MLVISGVPDLFPVQCDFSCGLTVLPYAEAVSFGPVADGQKTMYVALLSRC